MYKVVIIDDEPLIVEGLSRTVHWGNWECRVAGTAYNGEEGITLIREEQPDIIVTDISMPGKNGLVMIAGIRSEFPDTRITILTGYRDFDYAREAIRLGVDRFLLKPSRMDELEGAVEYMTQQLQKRGIWPEKQSSISGSGRAADTGSMAGAVRAAGTGGMSGAGGTADTGSVSGAGGTTDTGSMARPAGVTDSVKGRKEEAPEIAAAGSFIVKNAMTYIEAHSAEKLRLNEVADQIYVSQWHLSKLLNRHTGKNFSEILNGIRIEKAKELLKDSSRRIGDVAEEVGFQDLAHFSRVFKNYEGMPANEYRNSL